MKRFLALAAMTVAVVAAFVAPSGCTSQGEQAAAPPPPGASTTANTVATPPEGMQTVVLAIEGMT